jgi:hypothetical protein
MKNKDMNTGSEKKEKTFERPIIILIVAVSLVTLGLVFEAFLNHSKAKMDFQNRFQNQRQEIFKAPHSVRDSLKK